MRNEQQTRRLNNGSPGGMTFERACGVYWVVGVLLALIIPNGRGLDGVIGIDPADVPLASIMVNISGRIDYIGLYFLFMWIFMPILLIWLAKHPQRREQFGFMRMDFTKVVGATLVCAIAIVGLLYFVSMDPITCPKAVARGKALICFASRYKVGLGVVGGGLMLTFALAAYGLVVRVPVMWKEYLGQDK